MSGLRQFGYNEEKKINEIKVKEDVNKNNIIYSYIELYTFGLLTFSGFYFPKTKRAPKEKQITFMEDNKRVVFIIL